METVLTQGGNSITAELVKKLAGRDSLADRGGDGLKNLEFHPSHKVFLMTGGLPRSLDGEVGSVRRLTISESFDLSFFQEGSCDNARI